MDEPQLNIKQPVRLVCPVDQSALVSEGRALLRCEHDHKFPVVDGIPVLLDPDRFPDFGAAEVSWMRANGIIRGDARAPELYLETLGISEAEKALAAELWMRGPAAVDPAVQMLVGATCGTAYQGAMGSLEEYPIPHLPLSKGEGRVLVDIGCNWGRWSIGAAKLGYSTIGCDPQLGAVAAAARVSRQIGVEARYLCADARFLPLPDASADVVLSYSVLQHFSVEDTAQATREIGRVLRPGGLALVQMANVFGVRSLYQLARRGFAAGRDFEVRYYTPAALIEIFARNVGRAEIVPDCYLGLGLQATDRKFMTRMGRMALAASEAMKRIARYFPPLGLLADSVWVRAMKADSGK